MITFVKERLFNFDLISQLETLNFCHYSLPIGSILHHFKVIYIYSGYEKRNLIKSFCLWFITYF